jgi:hypothetical protein
MMTWRFSGMEDDMCVRMVARLNTNLNSPAPSQWYNLGAGVDDSRTTDYKDAYYMPMSWRYKTSPELVYFSGKKRSF